ncbi:MAG TPA: hypothetical protein VGY99_14860, partial [Candidatus Binataceae bacterium]|nr:hypothetical protein [Candidatus Binataceae bacterium]
TAASPGRSSVSVITREWQTASHHVQIDKQESSARRQYHRAAVTASISQTNDHGLVLRHILSSLQSTSVIERRRVNAKRILP